MSEVFAKNLIDIENVSLKYNVKKGGYADNKFCYLKLKGGIEYKFRFEAELTDTQTCGFRLYYADGSDYVNYLTLTGTNPTGEFFNTFEQDTDVCIGINHASGDGVKVNVSIGSTDGLGQKLNTIDGLENHITVDGFEKGDHNSGRYIGQDGSVIGSGSYFSLIKIKNENYSRIKARLGSSDKTILMIAFYSSEEMNSSSFIRGIGCHQGNTIGNYESEIPKGCETIGICYRNTISPEPRIRLYQESSGTEDNNIGTSVLPNDNSIIPPSSLYEKQFIKENWPYYFGIPENPGSFEEGPYLDKKILSVPKGVSFIFFTDTHWSGNSEKSHHLISYVKQRLGIRNVVFGGDGLDGEENRYKAAIELSRYTDDFYSAFGKQGLFVVGNHDANGPAFGKDGNKSLERLEEIIIPDTEIYKRTLEFMEGTVVFDDKGIELIDQLSTVANEEDRKQLKAWMRMHYYYDDEVNKIRYIVLETSDVGLSMFKILKDFDGSPMYNEQIFVQMDFFCSALMSLPDSSYKVVVTAHYLKGAEGNTSFSSYIPLLYAYKNRLKQSCNPMKLSSYPIIEEIMQKQGWAMNGSGFLLRTFDFTVLEGTPGQVLMITGHQHYDYQLMMQKENDVLTALKYSEERVKPDAVILIWTTTDAYEKDETNEDKVKDNGAINWNMTKDTVTENAFDVVTFAEDGGVYCTRFGAGKDRAFREYR